ncbi:hypothetical protein Dgeo_1050 [Deinococcus geothermalis DSM 11300]|uniref:Uncharacterized protein n=1 Tax=Deinococcus geothermalis (strain DSM 11300 / CIP 105573 / AG-3a) TaxID=319795 RepID=Q1IZI5_DEIGD|nr:hypothetical protein Dgeo_1050 [Deinococcus geothermalis DSM 11300]
MPAFCQMTLFSARPARDARAHAGKGHGGTQTGSIAEGERCSSATEEARGRRWKVCRNCSSTFGVKLTFFPKC